MQKIYSILVNPKCGPPFTAKVKAQSQIEALCVMQGMFADTVELMMLEHEGKKQTTMKPKTNQGKNNE